MSSKDKSAIFFRTWLMKVSHLPFSTSTNSAISFECTPAYLHTKIIKQSRYP